MNNNLLNEMLASVAGLRRKEADLMLEFPEEKTAGPMDGVKNILQGASKWLGPMSGVGAGVGAGIRGMTQPKPGINPAADYGGAVGAAPVAPAPMGKQMHPSVLATEAGHILPAVAGAVTPAGVLGLSTIMKGLKKNPTQPLSGEPTLPVVNPMGKGGSLSESVQQMKEAVSAMRKRAFVPGPQIQRAIQEIQQQSQQAQQTEQQTAQAQQQAQAQAQGAQPVMRLEDLAQMLQELGQGLQQQIAQITQIVQQQAAVAAAGGGGEKKKMSPQELNSAILQKLDQITQAIGVAPAGPGAAPQAAPGAANDPAAQQAPQSAGQPAAQPQG